MKFTTIRRGLALALAAILGACAAVAFSIPTVGEAAANTVYSKTYAGTDAHSLDNHIVPQFVVGGGVQPMTARSGAADARYLELGLDLPVGAKVTSVAITYAGSSAPDSNATGTYTFGSYQPATGATQQVYSVRPPSSAAPQTVTRTGNPVVTVAAGRRYVIDWDFAVQSGTGHASPGLNTWYGATVKYTCTAPCVP